MKGCKAARFRLHTLIVCFCGILFFSVCELQSPLFADDEIAVKRDKEKTVYSIGPSDKNRREEAKDRDRAWEMLNNMNIIMDKRKSQPAQPAAGQ